ncbi:MAG TPA: 1-acyl-sn-glycerol-3-phosphate acyltransferase [Steroidobacteraceae bacterium]|nr:1-acyl-sn-glycerol-3-phosphate acyltransferase [Steroidobacteraceae bacterium]HQR49015.1 1-acyl-sn-glycerol-3-phosphate acyltransferase [Steroidobacteraceae bacterium]
MGTLQRYARRAVTIPAVALALLALLAALPVLLPLAFVVDLARAAGRRSFVSVRIVLFGVCFLATEVLGLALLFGVWLSSVGRPELRAARTWPVQRWYTAMHYAALRTLFRLRFEVEGDAAATPGPLLVLVRHASIIDSLVPAVFIANVHRTRLRYVLKRELLVDPCLDLAGHWLPNRFVARGGVDTAREVDSVRSLKAGLEADEGVLLYPEGTRFTEEKRRRVIERLGGAARERAERLQHLLPIRPGGVLALLDAPPACDVLFIAHHGLEGFAHVADVLRGALVGRTVRLRFWRVPAASIPAGAEKRRAWLADEWQRMDDWLSAEEDRDRTGLPAVK